MKIGVTGPKSRLGSYLIHYCGAQPIEVDITDEKAVKTIIEKNSPDVLINCAAYTDVDAAQENYDHAIAVNTMGVGYLRAAFSGYMIHMSTLYVFDGKKSGKYHEWDTENPIGDYGMSKFGGEAIMLGYHDHVKSCVIRTVGLYTPYGDKPDIVRNIISQLKAGEVVSRNPTYRFNPTYIPHLAEALAVLALRQIPGVINLTGKTSVDMFSFARRVARQFFGYKVMKQVEKGAVHSTYRPYNTSSNLRKAIGLRLPLYSLRAGLTAMKKEYNA